jgi:hypothetical protein
MSHWRLTCAILWRETEGQEAGGGAAGQGQSQDICLPGAGRCHQEGSLGTDSGNYLQVS